MIKNLPLFICFVMLSLLSCWDRQDNNVNVPETPVYNLYGSIISSLTNEPLSDVYVVLYGYVKYNEENESQTLYVDQITDENGMFLFKEIPGGFEYFLTAEKEGYKLLAEKLVTCYEDKNVGELVLGKLLNLVEKVNINDVEITGIAHNGKNIWLVDTSNLKIIELNEDLTIKNSTDITLNTPLSLAWDGQWFWSCDPEKDVVFSFQVDNFNHVRYGDSYPSPRNFYNPDKIVDLLDMTFLNNKIWACSNQMSSKYFKFNPAESEGITYFDSPTSCPIGIATDSTYIFLLCHYSGYKLYLINKDTNEILGYYMLPNDGCLMTYNDNCFWIAKNDSIIKLSF